MEVLKLTFSAIMQTGILFYDEAMASACHTICHTLNIDNMPDHSGHHLWELTSGTFRKAAIKDSQKLRTDDRIFSDNAMKKFKNNRHNVLFVYEGDVIRGVVHMRLQPQCRTTGHPGRYIGF